jgi:superfamily I DNA/RNA helicase
MNTTFTASKFQKDIFETFQKTKENLVISAVAGSGKTTTILELLKFIPAGKKTIFLAFNKSIAEELAKKIPKGKNIEAINFHAYGARVITREYKGQSSIVPSKLYGIAKKCLPDVHKYVEEKKIDLYLFNLTKIVNLYRLSLLDKPEEMSKIIEEHGFPQLGNELQDAQRLLLAYREYNKTWRTQSKKFMIDFADMLYLPVKRRYLKNDYDYVFVDEVQDLNAVQQEFITGLLKPGGKFVAVGDRYQSIYGFMGADAESYQKIVNRPNTVELPLSFSYRCGKKIAEMANTIYPIIESPDDIQEGEVITGSNFDTAQGGDFVLCRNIKPLVELYFTFIDKEKTSYVKGKEIGDDILGFINPYKKETKETLLVEIEGVLKAMESRLKSKGVKEKSIPYNRAYSLLKEKIEIIQTIAKKYETTEDIIACVGRIFKDVGDGIMLSTIHKSKGLETDNVFIFRPSLIPSPLATKPWQIEQEKNLLYVAYTRAKQKLHLVE